MGQVLHKPQAFRDAEFVRQRALDEYRIVDTLSMGRWMHAQAGQEPLEPVFLRADEALSVEKDKLRPPPIAA